MHIIFQEVSKNLLPVFWPSFVPSIEQVLQAENYVSIAQKVYWFVPKLM